LAGAVEQADIAITSTAAEEFLLTRALVAEVVARRAQRPLAIVDIAVPRNVEPTVAEVPGVSLANIDDLKDICATNLEQRRQEGRKVEAIVEEEVDRYVRWWQAREVAPTISALVRKAESIRQEELGRAISRLGPLSDREQNALNALTLAIVNKMLHTPITRLKESGAGLDGKHYVHAVRELFDLPTVELAGDQGSR
jgi:glutamyl-tRNA reductase